MAGSCWVATGGKNAIGVSPAGTNPAAIAWTLVAATFEVDVNSEPPPTKMELYCVIIFLK